MLFVVCLRGCVVCVRGVGDAVRAAGLVPEVARLTDRSGRGVAETRAQG